MGAITFSYWKDGVFEKVFTVLMWSYLIGSPISDYFTYFN